MSNLLDFFNSMEFYQILVPIFIFLFGICWGSFLNVWVYRIPLKRSVAGGRSGCMTCGHELNYKDLVPVFSFLFLRGKCRYCQVKLSWQYPAIELLVGLLFLLTYFLVGVNWQLGLFSFALITTSVVMGKIDWNVSIIPNVLTYPMILIGIVYMFVADKIDAHAIPLFAGSTYEQVMPTPNLTSALIASLGFFAIMLVFYFISGGGIGMGDIKWIAMTGLFFGWELNMLSLLIATFTSVLYTGIIYLFFKKRIKALPNIQSSFNDEEEDEKISEEQKVFGVSVVNGKPSIVLGPFLALSTLVIWFFGIPIGMWYMGF